MARPGVASACLRLLIAVVLSLVAVACQRNEPPSAVVVDSEPTFTGSAACRDCHVEQYEAWTPSHHALAMQPASPSAVAGNFDAAELSHFGVASSFYQRDGNYFVRTEGALGELSEFRIAYTFGIYPLQQYLVEFADGRLQALPIAWDSRPLDDGGQRWFHLYPDEPIPSDDALYWTRREQNWNYMCAECHSTDLEKNYAAESDTFQTTWSDINVACEGCHGPGSLHVSMAESDRLSGDDGLTVSLDDHGRAVWEMDPRTGIAARSELRMRPPVQPEACGRCHSRRAVAASRYDFSSSLFDTHLPSLLDDPLYYADGQIREEVYVYGSFLQSRMYQAGVTCTDCHDPHSARLKTGGEPSAVCATCHSPAVFDSVEHHRHPDAKVGCVDCHMRATTYMVVDDRRDHSFRVPDPALSAAVGSPDACTDCHAEEGVEWAAESLRAWNASVRGPHYGRAIHAGRSGAPNDMLVEAAARESYPGIARGTLMALLRPPYAPSIAGAVQQGLQNPDPFVRLGALRAARGLDAPDLLRAVLPLLDDPLRALRNEAAALISPLRTAVPPDWQGIYASAEAGYIDAAEAIEERPEAQVMLAGILLDRGQADAALARYRKALAMAPDSTAVLVNLADAYRRLGRDVDAETLLRNALADTPGTAALRHALGLLLVRSGRAEEGLQSLARAAELDGDNPRYVYVYGIALNSTGRPVEAIDLLTEASRRFPMDFDIHWGLATILRDQQRTAEALAVARKLRDRYPGVPSVASLERALAADL